MLQIRCKNNNVTKSFPEGCSLLDVYQEFQDEIKLPYPVVSAKVNNASQGLKFRLFQNRDVEFLDAREGSGHRVYVRSLSSYSTRPLRTFFPVQSSSSSTRCVAATTAISRRRVTTR